MKFCQQFEIIAFAPNFEAISHVALVIETVSKVWRKKWFDSKLAQVWQKIFYTVICLKIFYHPNQPRFGHDEFFLPKSCTLFS